MKTLQMIKAGNVAISLQDWKGMPKAHKTPEGYKLVVDGKDVVHPEVQLTGGGSFPAYTYLLVNGSVKWFSGQFETGTAVQIVDPTPPAPAQAQPTQTVTQAIAGPAEAPAKPQGKGKGK